MNAGFAPIASCRSRHGCAAIRATPLSRLPEAAVPLDVALSARRHRTRKEATPLTALAVTALAVSCAQLPDTGLKRRAGSGGAETAGAAGVVPNGAAGTSTTQARTGGSAGSGGYGAGGLAATAGSANARAGAAGSAANTGAGGAKGGAGAKAGGGRSSGAGGAPAQASGAPDAGAPDAGAANGGGSAGFSTNRGDFFGESRCKNAGFALCEDFESGSLDTGTWKSRGAAPTIETVRAARGTHSAHFHTTDNGLSYITQTKTFPAPNDTYYARVFVWFEALPTAPAWAHWTISGAQAGTAQDAPEIRVGGQWDSNHDLALFGVGSDRGDTGDWTNLDADPAGKPKAVPAQAWVCLEWMFDGSANQTKFWWDGVEHPSLATSSTNHGGTSDAFVLPQFDAMWIGWWLYQANTDPPAFDVWFDEVAVDYARIGCNR